ncbi:MAG: DUF4342 domain-containing protein [Clostridia bacterium]|nr:DUF4342 domain-containing protein [Clostridia bacterium]
MTQFEMVEKLCEKANVSYEEAKAALEAANWDLLDAVVFLEQEGKIKKSSAQHSTQAVPAEEEEPPKAVPLRAQIRKLWQLFLKLVAIGNQNHLVVSHKGKQVFSLPVTVVVILMICSFMGVLVAVGVSLFFGVRYSFKGEQLGKENVNNAMQKATDMAEQVKESFEEELKK